MCRLLVAVHYLLVPLLLLGRPALAQQSALLAKRDSLARRAAALQTLAARFDTALAAANAQLERERAAVRADTVVAGRFRLTARGVAPQLARRVAQAADSLLAASWARDVPHYPGAAFSLEDVVRPDGGPRVTKVVVHWPFLGAPRNWERSYRLGAEPERYIGALSYQLADLWLVPWRLLPRLTSGGVVDVTTDTAQLASAVYRELATSPFHAGRTCLAGDLGACARVMGLTAPVPPYDDLLDASGRAAVLSDGASYRWDIPFADREACVDTQAHDLCLRAFTDVTPKRLQSFFANDARRLLTARLLAGAAPTIPARNAQTATDWPMASLGLLAGDTLPRALAAWHEQVVRSRPKDVLPTAFVSWGTLALATIISLLGLRTSRWRSP